MENYLLLVALGHYISKMDEDISADKMREYNKNIDEITTIFIQEYYRL
jgi:hypothetical protein